MTLRRLMAGLAPVAAVLAAAPAALAAPTAHLAEAGGATFPAKRFILTLPASRALHPGDVRVGETGKAVDGLRVVSASAGKSAVIVAIDTSQSMRGAPLTAAMAAARRFAAGRPPGQRLGVVFFNHRATVALAPTTDATRITRVLAAPPALGAGTRIYDATALAVRLLARTGADLRSVVVLSDGADAGSRVSPATVVDAARQTQTRVFGFGLRSRSYDGSTLTHLARMTAGRSADAGRQGLTQLLAALGRRFGREYLLSYRSLAPASAHVGVRVRVAGIPGVATATYTSPALRPTEAAKGTSATAGASAANLSVAIALAALLCGAAAFLLARSGRRTVTARIAGFTTGESAFAHVLAAEPTSEEADVRTRPRRAPSRRWAAFAEDVDIAGLKASPERIAGWTVAGTLLVAAAALALGHPALAVLALPAPVVARIVVSARANGARRKFESQLADNLQVVASAMRAGQTFAGALAVSVEDASEPVKRELHRSVVDERLGVPLDEAIGRVARRMRSEELDYVGLVATLQRETGGSTAEVLDHITQTIRERAELKRLVRGLTAQGRLGGGVVTAIPLALAALFAVIQPGYFDPLLHNAFGLMCLGLGAAMLTTGWIAIRKIVDIEV